MTGKQKNEFGTFAGVFTPSILTILGVIMFMNAGSVVGYAGLLGALIILVLCKSITSLTSLSISAISTNMDVKGGGSYYLISRSLGAEPGGAIGVSLYLALALSVPFYIIGLVHALMAFESLRPFISANYLYICIIFAVIFFIITYVGAQIALKIQFLILISLGISILTFMAGLTWHFEWDRLIVNMAPAAKHVPGNMPFWVLFAIYFPAVTGITAGVSMSGDLKEPSKSIPDGTLAAVGIGFLIYALQMVLMAGGIDRASGEGIPSLTNTPYLALKAVSGKFGLLVAQGAIAATASSTIGSFIGSPRILQALSRDRLYKVLAPFGKGSKKGDEPRRALWLTFFITIVTLVLATTFSENALNAVAAILTMFFLASYGTVNISAFVEAFGSNPSFRPTFRFFHWSTALLGALGCLATAILINWIAAIIAAIIIFGLYFYLATKHMRASFGDARRGFTFMRARNAILKLRDMPRDAKNWRPNIIVMSGIPETRYTLVRYALWMEAGRGLLTLANFVIGDISEMGEERKSKEEELFKFIDVHKFPALAEVNITYNFDAMLSTFLQAHSLRPLRPNVLMMGWPGFSERAEAFVKHMKVANELDMSLLALSDKGLPDLDKPLRIDLWWRGLGNGSLMLILSYLMTQTPEWKQAEIRLLRVVNDEASRIQAEAELNSLVEKGRMTATSKAVVSKKQFKDIVFKESKDASAVFLGFRLPPIEEASSFYATYKEYIEKLPTTILVCSSGDADLFA
ncbi:MAG: amino acid permease [Deltaproteobacteria bacterium]|nr:amino acid permease [Deltaproteobacteria bacterium]